MPKGCKKRNMKMQNEKNLKKYFHNNRPMYDELMTNVQKLRNYRYFNNHVPPSESQNHDTNETQSENTEDIITPGGSKEPRVIRKKSLYINPEGEPDVSSPPQTYALGYSENNVTYWQRASDTYTESYLPRKSNRPPPSQKTLRKQARAQAQKNKVETTLNKMLLKPVEISKGKSLLEKMGWTGGGLGKDGKGIVNPIVPKATYAASTLGLGHNSETEREKKKPLKKINTNNLKFNHNFQTNVLLKILEFVKNDSEVDLLFEQSLYHQERKKIHSIVEALRSCTDVYELAYIKPLDVEVAREILSYNTYLLQTVSYGKHPARALRLYKDAPSYVYLITPDDLKDDDDEEFNDFCEPLEIDNKDKTENEIETFTEKVKHLEVEKDETGNVVQDHSKINLNSSIEENTITREDLRTKNDDPNLNHELNIEKVSDSQKFMEVDNSTSSVNSQLDSKLHSKNDPNLNLKLDVEKVSDGKKFMEVDNTTSNVNSQSDSELHSKNHDPNLNLKLDVEKVSDGKKFMEVDNTTSNVNPQSDSELHSKNHDPNLNLKLDVEKVSDGKKFMEVDNTTSNVNSQSDSELHSKNHDPNLNLKLDVEKVSDGKKFMEVDNTTSNVNPQSDSELHSKNHDPNLNLKLDVEKVSDGKKFMEVDNTTSNVNCQLDTKQYSKTESLECSLNNDKTIEKVLEDENKEKLNLDSNIKIEQEVKNIENENPGNELNESSEQNSEKTLLSVIVDYFKEFMEDTNYLELRFLGPFSNEEVDAINKFFDICLKRDNEDSVEKTEILKALNNEVYDIEIKENLNGSNVVYKSEKCLQQTTPQ